MGSDVFREFDFDAFTPLIGGGGAEGQEPDAAEAEAAGKAQEAEEDAIGKDTESENHVRVRQTISRHAKRRVLSEIKLEQELPWHFENGVSYHCFSWGDVDSLTYFRAIVKQQKIRYAFISTWCMAMEDCNEIEGWIKAGYVGRCDFYIGEIFKASYYPEYEKLTAICKEHGGRVCMFRNHSKVMVLLGERFDAVIESSANVNTNPRSEQTVITVDKGLAAWYKEIFDGIRSFERHFDEVKPYGSEGESEIL